MSWCDYGDLPAAACAHCKGVTEPDATGMDVTPPPAPRMVVTVRPQRWGKTRAQLASDRLTQLLSTTPGVYDDMGQALHGVQGGGYDAERVSGGGSERPLPLQVGVVEHRHQLVHDLRFWTAQVWHETPQRVTAVVGDSVPRMCAVLIASVPAMSAEDAESLAETLADWQAGTRHMNDLPKLRTSIPLPANTCPGGVTDVWECPGALRVMVPADRGKSAWLQCAECKARYAVTDLPAAVDVPLPLSLVANLTGTPEGTLKTWVHYGDLEPVSRGPITVRLGDVLQRVASD